MGEKGSPNSKCESPGLPFVVGDRVRVRDQVKDPQYGWGDVEWGDIGQVVSIRGDICLVSFPTHFGGFPLWKGSVSELQFVEDIGTLEGLIDVNHRLFSQRSPDDITIEVADGTEYAHRSMLMAASDVFGAMFSQGARSMQEGQTGRVHLPNVKLVVMRVFLRLLYTGVTEPADWTDEASSPEMPLEILLGVTTLARKYMVAHVLEAATSALKLRLHKAAAEGKMSDFEEIWRQAIVGGIDTVRMNALQMVKDTICPEEDESDEKDDDDNPTEVWGTRVKARYEARGFGPEIMFELQVLWAPPAKARKYRRLI